MLLYNADCRQIIPLLEYDSVVTDPWYGAVTESDTRKDGDGYPEWCLSWFPLLRQRKAVSILMTVGTMNVGLWARLGAAPGCLPFDRLVAWLKGDEGYVYGYEPVLGWGEVSGRDFFICEDGCRIDGFRTKSLEWALEMVSRVPGKVLDPFMGMGVVGLACKQLGREFIGIEHDPKIFNVARDRLA